MTATVEGKDLVLRLPIETPKASATGKTLVVASSHGNKETQVKINGQPVYVGVNAYTYPPR